jgi:two-component system response regulator AgrA
MDFLGSLNALEVQLGDSFVRTHRAYLVAADKIEAVDLKHSRLWTGGHECLLSRAGKAALRRKTGGSQ